MGFQGVNVAQLMSSSLQMEKIGEILIRFLQSVIICARGTPLVCVLL